MLKQFRGKQRLLQEVGWTGPSNAELNTAFIVLGADACSFENLVRPFTFCLSRCFLLKEYSALSKIFHFEVCERKIVVVKKLVKIICLLYFKKNKGKDQEINKQNSLNFCLCWNRTLWYFDVHFVTMYLVCLLLLVVGFYILHCFNNFYLSYFLICNVCLRLFFSNRNKPRPQEV